MLNWRKWGIAWAALYGVASLWASAVRAEPNVRVRAESRIEIGVEYVGSTLQVRGALRDELGDPIREVDVAVTLRGAEGKIIARRQIATDQRGRFLLERHAPQSQIVLQAAYAGDTLHRGVRVERRIDRNRADVRLELQLPGGGRLDLDAPQLPVRVLAESDSGGHALPMTLRDETGRVLAEGKTNALGRLTWQLDSDALGPPGSGQLQLESRGDATRGEAQTEARIVRFRRVQLDLQPAGDPPEAGRATYVAGTLQTRAGPRSGQPVGVFVEGEHATTAITDENGQFTAELWPANEGPLTVVARAEKDPVGAYTEAQKSIVLAVGPPGSLPWHWLALVVLPGVLWWVVSARRQQRPQDEDEPAENTTVAGVRAAPRTRRRATEEVLSGRVLHARTRAPIAQAIVQGRMEGQPTWQVKTDKRGNFEVNRCNAPVELRISAHGFAEIRTRANCPHRGEWRNCQIRLESLRDRAVRPYRKAVLPRLPSALSFNLWTPREIGRALKGQFGPDIEHLSQRVEQAAYAATPPDADSIRSIEAQVSELAAEVPRDEARGLRPPDSHS